MNNNNSTDYKIMSEANMPTEPSPGYIESLSAFDSVLKESILLSKEFSGIPSPTSKHFYASVLYTALIVRGVSLINLAPHNTWSSKSIEHWDYATCCNIARTILEIRLCFHYLCVEDCDSNEWDCRWNILNLHDCTARIRLFTSLENQDQIKQLTVQAEELKERLTSNAFFASLKPGEQKKYLNGQTAYMQPLEEIAEKIDIDRPTFRWMYTFLSSHVHALPLSFYRIGLSEEERGRGLPSPVEESYTSLCLSLSSSLLKGAGIALTEMFKEIKVPDIQYTNSESIDEIDKFSNIGETIIVDENKHVKVTVFIESETRFLTRYYHKKNNEIVLELINDEDNQFINSLDPTFWRIDLNGEPATYNLLEDYLNSSEPSAYQVDHNNYCIRIKQS